MAFSSFTSTGSNDSSRGSSAGVSSSVRGEKKTTRQFPSKTWVALFAVLCLVAIVVSGYLGYVAITSSKVAGCGGGRLFNCGHVISSRWSLWMGIPVSLLAVGLYLGMAGSLLLGASPRFGNVTRQVGWGLVTILAISAGLSAIWFISLQVFVLNHLCAYCLVAHACGLIAAGAVLWIRPIGFAGLKLAAVLGVVGISVLVVGQLASKTPETFRIETFDQPANKSEGLEFEAPVFEAPVFESPTTPTEPTGMLPVRQNLMHASTHFLRPISMLASGMTLPVVEENQATNQTQDGKTQDAQTQDGKTQDGKTQDAQTQDGKTQDGKTQDGKTQDGKTQDGKTQDGKTQEKADTSKKAERRMVSMTGGSIQLDVAHWPLVGSQTAKYVFVEMFDYSCPHCRNTHAAIKAASESLKGELAVVALPVPLNSNCNGQIQVTDAKFIESCEISKLAVAVWRVDADKFSEFHNWMFSGAKAPTYAEAKSQAEKLVDSEKLSKELATNIPAQYVSKTVELYKRVGSGNVPKLIFPATSVVGEFTSGNALVDIIKQQLK